MAGNWRRTIAPASKILRRYSKDSAWTLVGVAALVLLSSIASVLAPYLFSSAIDRLNARGAMDAIILGLAFYAAILGASVTLRDMVAYLAFMSSENLSFIAGTAFFEALLKKSISFFVDHNPAEIQSALVKGQQALNGVVQLALIILVPGTAQIVASLFVLGTTISLDVALTVVAYGLAFIAITYVANKNSNAYLEAAIDATQENAKFVGNAINAMETLRHFGSDAWMTDKFSEKAREIRDNWRHFCLRRTGYAALYGVALTIQLAITFALLLPKYRVGQLSVGDIVLFNTLLLQLNLPFETIGQAIDNMARSYNQFLPFARMWSEPDEPTPSNDVGFQLRNGSLTFRKVAFTYPNGRGVEDVSFSAERGRVTYLAGETGSGKSTVFKLALKSLTPQSGEIAVDGVDLASIARSTWYSVIGVVPQEILLLNDSLAANIALGRRIDAVRLRQACKRAAILDHIEALEDGFDTRVGERGLKLSGGERQRIAIARALYAEPQILFLDEASSALDEATEREIMKHIRRLAHEVTVIAITHRKSVIEPSDHVIELGARFQPC